MCAVCGMRKGIFVTLEAADKLARTFAAQAEALKRYRTGGEQKVTVQHVTVNDGGQAVVGTVTTKGRGQPKDER